MLLCLLATAQAATPTRTTVANPQLLPAEAWDRIRTGRVHVERDFIDATLAQRLRADATLLQERGLFRPDGLSRLGEARERQGFNRGDRQTYAGGAADEAPKCAAENAGSRTGSPAHSAQAAAVCTHGAAHNPLSLSSRFGFRTEPCRCALINSHLLFIDSYLAQPVCVRAPIRAR